MSGATKVATTRRAQSEGTFRLCVIEGDGIGREVIPAAVEVLAATGFAFETIPAEAGWACFQKHGTALPPETLEAVRSSNAILFGAVSSPSYKVPGYSSPIIALRQQLDLFANLRPCRSWPVPTDRGPRSRSGIDLLIVRENSEGLYVGRERSDGQGELVRTAIAERVITRRGAERIARVACDLAMQRRRQLTIVHKANVLPETCGLFRRTALDVAASYPELEVEEMLVDTTALRLVTAPERFDVIVTTNLFGDILSDEAAGLVGGLGLAPSANIGMPTGPGAHALFEPVHGSAPDIAGQGIANPLAAILAVAMLFDYVDHVGHACSVTTQRRAAETERIAETPPRSPRADRIRQAVEHVLRAGPHTPDLGGSATTVEVTEAIKWQITNSKSASVDPKGGERNVR